MILIVFTLSVTAVRRWQSGLQEAVVLNFNSFQPLMGKKIDLVDLAAKIGMEDIKSLIFFMIYKKLVQLIISLTLLRLLLSQRKNA